MRQGIIVLALFVAGCSNSLRSADTPTLDTRSYVLANMKIIFKDPPSVRDLSVGPSSPELFGWSFCMQSNAKNSFGGYTGLITNTVYVYANGSPPMIQEPSVYTRCGTMTRVNQ